MGYDSYTFGFNEPTLASLAYVCYFLAFLFYSGYLMARSSRALRVARGQVALVGAGVGGASVVGSVYWDGTQPRAPSGVRIGSHSIPSPVSGGPSTSKMVPSE